MYIVTIAGGASQFQQFFQHPRYYHPAQPSGYNIMAPHNSWQHGIIIVDDTECNNLNGCSHNTACSLIK